ncbi:MAG TPA: hypothetical protein VN761_09910, partial [Candidatus Polarisedimenticolia bacterium]|nr:hypothetical protein [Candidatus Polarisedimenticolia bacterium]
RARKLRFFLSPLPGLAHFASVDPTARAVGYLLPLLRSYPAYLLLSNFDMRPCGPGASHFLNIRTFSSMLSSPESLISYKNVPPFQGFASSASA